MRIATFFFWMIMMVTSLLAQTSPKSLPTSRSANLQIDYNPESGASPSILMSGPKDGVDYFEARIRARRLLSEENYVELEHIGEQLVRDYPRDPENWKLLERAKTMLKKPLEAAIASEQVGKLLGWDVGFWSGYRVAEDYLKAGNKRAALDLLKHVIFEKHGFLRTVLYDDPDYAGLKNDPDLGPEFLRLIGHVDTTGWPREKGWAYDIDFLYEELKRVNPDYRDKPFPAELERRFRDLKNGIPKMSDEEIFVGMARMLAILHQGHVSLFEPPNDRNLPVNFYAFPEGIFIIDAADQYRNLIGSRVTAIGGMPVQKVLTKIADTMSVDGNMQYLWGAPARMTSVSYLKGVGVIRTPASVPITVEQADGTKSHGVTLNTTAEPLAPRVDRMVAPSNVEAPLFLNKLHRQLLEKHWNTPLPEYAAMYVQVNNISNESDGETLVQFGQRLWAEIEKTAPKNVILDLRHNNGGMTQLYPELLRTLIAFSRSPGNQIYVLIGRRSYSATGNFVTDLERLTSPIFVGEASSECCNLYGDPISVTLPYSKIQAELTALKWQLSSPEDRRREISPQVPVQLTADAYFKGKDPALEAIYRLIKKNSAK